MPKCEDCEEPIIFLRKPEGGWLPPVEPILDFAYGDHFIATMDGVAQQMPQVYRKHACLTWEERQLKNWEREREKRELIEADRLRRAEERRLQDELEEARRAQEEERRAQEEEIEREMRQQRAVAAARQRERQAVQEMHHIRDVRFPKRLLPFPCRDCQAEADEPCRTDYWRTKASPHLWWQAKGHNARYEDAPPDDRSKIVLPERWGDDDDVWPPAENDPGRYEMRNWLKANYLYVFTPEKVWLNDAQQDTLTDWLADFGGIFEEVESDGPGDVAEEDAEPGAEGVRGRDAERAGDEEAAGDRVDPGQSGGAGARNGEQADRGESGGGTQWLRSLSSKS